MHKLISTVSQLTNLSTFLTKLCSARAIFLIFLNRIEFIFSPNKYNFLKLFRGPRLMIKTKWKSGVFFVWQNVRWKIVYIVLNEGTFTFIKVVGCSCLNFKLWSFFPCCNYITLAQSFTAIFIWWNKTLYTITDKDVDNNMFILRKFFRDLYVFLENTGHENVNIDILNSVEWV